MLLITDIFDAKDREAANAFLERSQDRAREAARSFDEGSTVSLGAVKRRGRGAAFIIAGIVNGVRAELVVAIPGGMPEGDTWSTWCAMLDAAGFSLEQDADYQAIVSAAAEQDAQWIEENAEYYLACVRAGQWPERLIWVRG